MKTISNYEQQAIDFLAKTGATIEVKFNSHGKHFDDDKDSRDIYDVTIKRGSRAFSLRFGQSIANSGKFLLGWKMAEGIPMRNVTMFNDIKEAKKAQFIGRGERKIIVKNEKFAEPNAYDILTCLTKYDPGTLEEFCDEFGYDADSKKAEKTYNAIKEEYLNVCKLFSDEEIELMQEIQ